MIIFIIMTIMIIMIIKIVIIIITRMIIVNVKICQLKKYSYRYVNTKP